MESIEKTLETMGLDYLDMMIIHSPQPWVEVNQSEDRYYEENREVWRALEDALEAGKLRAIGVSNFLEGDLENIFAGCRVKPMVNQILCHVGNSPLALIDYCRKRDIVVEELGLSISDIYTHAEMAAFDGYGIGSGDPDMRWDLLYVPDYGDGGRLVPGGELIRGKTKYYRKQRSGLLCL